MNRMTLCGSVAVAVFVAAAATAHDLNPPGYRGAPGSVFLHWDFQQTGGAPVGFGFGPDPDGPNGPATPNFEVQPAVDIFTPDPTNPFTTYHFTVPNWIDPFPFKRMRIQITYTDLLPDGAFPSPILKNIMAFDNGAPVDPADIFPTFMSTPEKIASDAAGISTFFFFTDWVIMPNPDFETFDINLPTDAGLRLDQVVFDSISFVPAPSGTLALTLLLFPAARRRRA